VYLRLCALKNIVDDRNMRLGRLIPRDAYISRNAVEKLEVARFISQSTVFLFYKVGPSVYMRSLLFAHCRISLFARPLISSCKPSYVRTSNIRTMASPAVLASRAVLSSIDLSKYDPEQSRLMDERCILVDEQDNVLGAADKKTCMSGAAACFAPQD
jgi:hypothetical protein